MGTTYLLNWSIVDLVYVCRTFLSLITLHPPFCWCISSSKSFLLVISTVILKHNVFSQTFRLCFNLYCNRVDVFCLCFEIFLCQSFYPFRRETGEVQTCVLANLVRDTNTNLKEAKRGKECLAKNRGKIHKTTKGIFIRFL